MSDIENDKEVWFHEYCPQCKYYETESTDDPCNECLTMGSRINTHKPLMYKEDKGNDKPSKVDSRGWVVQRWERKETNKSGAV